jgi:Zn-dependent protease with chaperone function/Zn-finger nucleic acid-binding protein
VRAERETREQAPRKTLFEVEREKRWRIWLLFGLLLAMAFVTAWVGCLLITGLAAAAFPGLVSPLWMFTLPGALLVLGVSLAASVLYWAFVQVGARDRLFAAMHCRPLDPGDRYHERLANIVEEMRIATGAPRVEVVTVRTVGLNAFAFSDLHGGGVIGVTEGALARLSRQELQAVVAHEFAHVLSGGYVTVTVSCLLFGVYSSLGDQLDAAADSGSDTDEAAAVIGMIPLRGWLWVMQLASSIVSAAISRERERQADLAAVRYTRDPLSLAEALRVISRHPGGVGYIPEGLAPLCIRATGTPGWPAVPWHDTHPPLSARISVLLALANESPDEFEGQAAQAGEHFALREHWSSPAGTQAAGAPALASSTTGPPTGAATAVGPPSGSPATAAAVRGPGPAVAMTCPGCGEGLSTAQYEGVDILVCTHCGGRLVSSVQVGKLLARREVGFTGEQERLADLVTSAGDRLRRAAILARGTHAEPLTVCPKCAAPMMRRHYSYDYAVEIDHCIACDLSWFEKDELEVLQLLVERQTG